MDATTQDFNAWLAQEGAKVGMSPPAQPVNYLRDVYGQGYLPVNASDSAVPDPTTADVLSGMDARYSGPAGYLRQVADAIPPSGRTLDPRGEDESLLSYWKRALDASSIKDMARGGLNTAANWLSGSPEIGPDTLAPLGLGAMGVALTPRNALAVPSLKDSTKARYLEWVYPDDYPAITGGSGQFNSARYLQQSDSMRDKGAIKHAALPTDYPRESIPGPANWEGSRGDRLKLRSRDGETLFSDQSRSSVPGTIVNSLPMDEASRLKRAREMGFDPGWYHGTRNAGFDEFRTDDALREAANNGFRGVSVTRSPEEASGYTGVMPRRELQYSKDSLAQKLGLRAPTRTIVDSGVDYGHGSGAVYPLAVRVKNPFVWNLDDFVDTSGSLRRDNDTIRRVKEIMPEYIAGGDFPVAQRAQLSEALARAGYDAIDIVQNGQIAERAVFDPKNIRSKYAAFDPSQSDSAFLLAAKNDQGSVPGTVVNSLAEQQGIRAYHVSPHDFDAFDVSKIGTGEGAQAYGHGLYFAENPKVSGGPNSDYWRAFASEFVGRKDASGNTTGDALATNALLQANGDRAKALAFLYDPKSTPKDKLPSNFREAVDLLESGAPVGPRNYEVSINASPDEFLDWDVPLSQQSEGVRKALDPLLARTRPKPEDARVIFERGPIPPAERHGGHVRADEYLVNLEIPGRGSIPGYGKTREEAFNNAIAGYTPDHGAALYESLARINDGSTAQIWGRGSQPTSQALSDAGIKGIRYKDQGSRGKEGGTNNYVVFSDRDVEILRKYGWVPVGMVGGGMMMAPPDEAQASK